MTSGPFEIDFQEQVSKHGCALVHWWRTLRRAAGARSAGSTGRAPLYWLRDGFLNRVRSIPFRMLASLPLIRDKNRMR